MLEAVTIRRGTGSQGQPTYMAVLSTRRPSRPPSGTLSARVAAAHTALVGTPAAAAERASAAAEAATGVGARAAGKADTSALAGAGLLALQLAEGVAGLASVVVARRKRRLPGCTLLCCLDLHHMHPFPLCRMQGAKRSIVCKVQADSRLCW